MTKKILILKSSPRQRGNSSTLADQVELGAQAAGAEVESINLNSLDIHPCIACDLCQGTGLECSINDDMQELYPKLLAADALVLASPIYWFTYSAQLKLCIDRWYGLWNNHPDFLRNKPVGIVLSYGDDDLEASGGINAVHSFEYMLRYLHAPIAGIVHGSLSDIGDTEKHPELLQAAYELGKQLAQ